jgi:HSP20 family protein
MADINIERRNQGDQSTAVQRRRGGGLARRGAWTPTLFPLSTREFFSSGPFEMMRRFSEEMDRMFEDFGLARGGWGFGGGQPALWSPAVEVFERDNNLVVRADLPGMSKDDVKVEMTDDGLVIQGERKSEREEEREGWYRSERSYGEFYRLIPLPEGVNAEQAKARFENGVLEVTAPIPEMAQRRRSIPVETGGGETAQAAGGASS